MPQRYNITTGSRDTCIAARSQAKAKTSLQRKRRDVETNDLSEPLGECDIHALEIQYRYSQ